MGLLLLRAAVGLSLAVQGVACLAGGDRGAWTVGPLAIVTGVSLLIGFLTPVTSGLAALFSLGVALSLLPPAPSNGLGGAPATIYLVVMAAAVLLLGPGAFSLDARFFGRREVVIPHVSSPPSED